MNYCQIIQKVKYQFVQRKAMKYGKTQQHRNPHSWFSVIWAHQKVMAVSMFMMTWSKNWWRKVYRKKRLLLFMMQIQKQRRRSCLEKWNPGRFVFWLVQQQRWVQEPMCRIVWLPCIIWILVGNHLTWNRGKDVLSVRETIIKRFISSGM